LLPVKEGRKEGNPNHSGAVPNDDDARARSCALCAACKTLRGTKQASVRLRSVGSGEREALCLRERVRVCGQNGGFAVFGDAKGSAAGVGRMVQ